MLSSPWDPCQIYSPFNPKWEFSPKISGFSRRDGNFRPRRVQSGLRPPPRSPAQLRFPAASGNVFIFPGLWRGRRGTSESLAREIGGPRQKLRPGLWHRKTFSRREFAVLTETGSTVDRDGFCQVIANHDGRRACLCCFHASRAARAIATQPIAVVSRMMAAAST